MKPDFERIERVTYQGNDDTSAGSCHKRKRNKIKQKVRNFFSPKERERERERVGRKKKKEQKRSDTLPAMTSLLIFIGVKKLLSTPVDGTC